MFQAAVKQVLFLLSRQLVCLVVVVQAAPGLFDLLAQMILASSFFAYQ
jgi:hypothetical protein